MAEDLENALFSDNPLSNAPLIGGGPTEGLAIQGDTPHDVSSNPFMRHVAEAAQQPSGPAASPFWASKTGRFLTGAAEPLAGTAQLAAHMSGYGTETTDKWANDLERFYQSQRQGAGIKPGEWDIPAGLGNIASPVNFGPASVLGRGKTVLGMLGRGAVAGGLYGATEPVTGGQDYTKEKLGQIETGAGAGAVAGPVSGLAAAAVDPLVGRIRGIQAATSAAGERLTPEESYALAVRSLNDQGVETMASMNWGPDVRRLEEIVGSLPVVGSYARGAETRMVASFDEAAMNRVLGHIGEKLPSGIQPGHQAVQYVAKLLGERYDELFLKVELGYDGQLQRDLDHILLAAKQELSPDHYEKLEKLCKNKFYHFFAPTDAEPAGRELHGVEAQKLFMQMNSDRTNWLASSQPFDRELGHVIGDVVDAASAALERQNPSIAGPLRDINLSWRDFTRVRAASASLPAQAHEGVFTATQLGSAVRGQDKTVGKTSSAYGAAPLQDLVEPARQVMRAQIPNSGTPERVLFNSLVLGSSALSPQVAAGAAMAPIMYTPFMQNLMRRYAMSESPLKGLAANMIRGTAVPATVGGLNQKQSVRPAGVGGLGYSVNSNGATVTPGFNLGGIPHA